MNKGRDGIETGIIERKPTMALSFPSQELSAVLYAESDISVGGAGRCPLRPLPSHAYTGALARPLAVVHGGGRSAYSGSEFLS